jgi:YfiR/HmsC-like
VAGASQNRSSGGWVLPQLACALLLVTSVLLRPALAAEPVSKEAQIQAVFLWRFAQFVQWPGDAFAHADSPLVIGVLGENPFGEALALAVKGETAHGRHIEVKYFRRADEIAGCHVLYISHSEASRLKKDLSAAAGKPILTVSDIDGFATEQGGMIRLVNERGRVSLRINLEATKAAGLVLDARLLRLAEVTGRQ